MKKVLFLLTAALMVLSLFAGCGGRAAAPSASPLSPPEPSPSPESEPYVPMALFDSPLNPFAEIRFPENFKVYAAAFDIGSAKLGGKARYALSMTAEGDTDGAIAFLADLSEDADAADRYIGDFNSYGFCEFPISGGLCTIRQTDANDDRYPYVDGCHIDLSAEPDSAALPAYTQFFSDNYNVNALDAAAPYFDVTPVLGEYGVYVNLHKKAAEFSLSYPLADPGAVQRKMSAELKSNWYDEAGGKMGLSYGMMDLTLTFGGQGGCVYVTESSRELEAALGAYTAPTLSLSTLGFSYYEQDALCIFEDKAQNYSLAIYRPEWGARPGDWDVEILQEMNGWLLAVWYSDDVQRLIFQLDKGGTSARFEYLIETGEYLNEAPDSDTVKACFAEAFGTPEDAVYEQALVELELLLQPRFGLSLQELYALPIR